MEGKEQRTCVARSAIENTLEKFEIINELCGIGNVYVYFRFSWSFAPVTTQTNAHRCISERVHSGHRIRSSDSIVPQKVNLPSIACVCMTETLRRPHAFSANELPSRAACFVCFIKVRFIRSGSASFLDTRDISCRLCCIFNSREESPFPLVDAQSSKCRTAVAFREITTRARLLVTSRFPLEMADCFFSEKWCLEFKKRKKKKKERHFYYATLRTFGQSACYIPFTLFLLSLIWYHWDANDDFMLWKK